MKFFSLNKSPLAKQVFDGIKVSYDEDALPSNAKKLIDLIIRALGIKKAKKINCDEFLTIDQFSDGEICPIFRQSIRDQHIFIMADGHKSDDILKLLLTIDAAKRSGAKKITIIYPYLPYSRQDKNDHVRSSIGAKLLADMLTKAGANRVIAIEMHSPAIQGFYDIPLIHLYGNRIFGDYAKSLNLVDVTNCSPDHGAIKRNADFSKYFPDALSAVIDKKRVKPNEIASMEITGEENIPGRNVVCVDDMGDTLGTLCKAAALVMSKGALTFRAFLTHPVLSGNALKSLYESQITELVVSDTIVSVYDKKKQYEEMLEREARIAVEDEHGNTELIYIGDDEGKSELEAKLIEIRAKHPIFTIVSSAPLLIKSINSLVNKKGSINEINNG